ncbi:hypothetical protein RCL1_003301 [Eukaryota sp. TZLM3-RCL]
MTSKKETSRRVPRPATYARIGLLVLLALGIWYLYAVEVNVVRGSNVRDLPASIWAAVFGWIACFLMSFQIGLGTRNKFLDKLIGLDKMWFVHRVLPPLIIALVILHAVYRARGREAQIRTPNFSYIEEVFEVKYPTLPTSGVPDANYDRAMRKINGQFSMHAMIVLSIISYLRHLPGKPYFVGKRKGLVPWWIWRPAHMLFYYAIALMIGHIRIAGNTTNVDTKWTLLGSRQSVYYTLIATIVYFGAKRVFDIFTKLRQGNLFTIISTEKISNRVTRVLMTPADGNTQVSYNAGQFVVINKPSKFPLLSTPHPLSLASAPNSFVHELIIGGCSNIGKAALNWKPGQAIRVDGYFGIFGQGFLLNESVALFAGGCGVAPCLSLLRHLEELAARNSTSEEKVHIPKIGLIFGAKDVYELKPTMNTILSLMKYAEQGIVDLKVRLLVDDPIDMDCKMPAEFIDLIRQGYMNRDDVEYVCPAGNTGNYICGPKPMVNAVKKHLKKLGVSKMDIMNENFLM